MFTAPRLTLSTYHDYRCQRALEVARPSSFISVLATLSLMRDVVFVRFSIVFERYGYLN